MKRTCLLLAALLFSNVIAPQLFAADSPKTFPVGGLNFSSPPDWTRVSTASPMRNAQFKVAGTIGTAEVVFFHFGEGQGGSVQANINRWFGQFAEPKDQLNAKTEKKAVNGLDITYVFAEGTYMSGPPFGQKTPVKNQALVGAIIKDDAGDVFVKMTGPKTITGGAQSAFKKMIESAKH